MESGWIVLFVAIVFAISLSIGFSPRARGMMLMGLLIASFCLVLCLGMFAGALCMSTWTAVLFTIGVLSVLVLLRKHFAKLPGGLQIFGIIFGAGAIIGALFGLIYLIGGQ